MVQEVRHKNEIEVMSPIHFKCVASDHAVSIIDTGIFGILVCQCQDVIPIDGRNNGSRQHFCELNAIESVTSSHIKDRAGGFGLSCKIGSGALRCHRCYGRHGLRKADPDWMAWS